MKKILGVSLAAVLAAATLAGASGEALAKHWMHPYPAMMFPFAPPPPAPGLFLSFGFGPPALYPHRYVRVSNPHVRWCFAHYPRTYNPATNLYFVKKGVPAVCVSPFSY